ncbi:DMT family transporter [Dactylosporangium fulvum]|uniref:DMT family transporter n=1 Tax=Dactylosporangium fulvum TaxID=53359 RepID=A0ABY5W5D8_9ACTN|nr:DMT family transporter [Dactylosporangium fulvum]UWP85253.1 DMT family transporter [Dactylosporangium fulvum]
MRNVRWVPLFLLLSLIWGASFLFIKVAVTAGVEPVWLAFWRCAFGAVALAVCCLVLRAPLSRDPVAWGHVFVVAALLNAVPFALFAYGQAQVTTVLAGVFNATTPLTTFVFALALVPAERPTARRLVGLVTAFVGVLVVLGVWDGLAGAPLPGALACLGGTLCYGAGFAYTRRFVSGRAETAATLSVMQIGTATLQLALVAPLVDGAPSWPGPQAALGLLVLGAAGTGVAYIMNLRIIQAAGPTVAASVTYVVPLWSTLFGAVLLGEPVGPATLVGAVLVIGGAMLTAAKRDTPSTVDDDQDPVPSPAPAPAQP